MASFEVSGLNEIAEQMLRLGQSTGEVADRMLIAGAKEVKKAWKDAAEKAGHRDTGRMIQSIDFPRKPKTIKEVRTISVYPQGKDKRGIRNAEKAFILHYGTSKIKGSNFVDDADNNSIAIAQEVMQAIWNKFLEENGGT